MRRLRKISNSFFLIKLRQVVFILMQFFVQHVFAGPADSTYNLIIPPTSTDTATDKHNYAATDFCNCTENQKPPVLPAARKVSLQVLDENRDKPDFRYERTVKDEASSFWANVKEWIIRKLFGNVTEETADKTWNLIYWILALFGISTVSFWLYKSEFLGSPMRRTSKIDTGIYDETERSEEDIEARINEALANNDYPLAIRWIYIKCIKALSVKNEINVRQDKTNYDYYLELKDRSMQEYFFQLTRIFEYTHYGHFVTGIANYQQAELIFKNISSKL